MLNEIIKGVARRLNAAFGDEYTIYQNGVRQGWQEPCFFIGVLQPEQLPLLGGRARRRNPLVVQYFPQAAGDNAELLDTAERLLLELTYIRLANGDCLRGTGMRYEIADGVLHFFVSYNMLVEQTQAQVNMEDLTVEQNTTK